MLLIANYLIFTAAIAVFFLFPTLSWAQSTVNTSTATASLGQRIAEQGTRLKEVKPNVASLPNGAYALEKAQCWLDFSRHEDLRNNSTRVPESAYLKAKVIADHLANKTPMPTDTLDSQLWDNSDSNNKKLYVQQMRKDLWQQLDAVKGSTGFSCSAKAVACGEVMLVQAAHAHDRFNWRYAQPYFGMAEDFVRDARLKAQSCKP